MKDIIFKKSSIMGILSRNFFHAIFGKFRFFFSILYRTIIARYLKKAYSRILMQFSLVKEYFKNNLIVFYIL